MAEEQDLPAVLRDRREKLERIRQSGRQPYVRSFPRTHTSAEARALLEGVERTDPVRVAGRLMVKRPHGGSTFADLRDGAGRIQLMVREDLLGDGEYQRFQELDPGDWIGVSGPVFRTRRGEVSIEVESFELLSKALRPLPEKWHGLRDVETRYRQRYVDLIANPDVRQVFVARAHVIAAIRRFLDDEGFLEVETPVLQSIPGGGLARPFKTHHNALDMDLYMRIALELHLKRLVVGGLERVYEIAKVFRNEGVSPRHNPEFTMLEAYQAYADYGDMMQLTERLVGAAAKAAGQGLTVHYQGEELDLAPPFRRVRMVDLVREHAGLDVLSLSAGDLARAAAERNLKLPAGAQWGFVVNELYEELAEPHLRQPTFVLDYPVDVSPLARRREDDPRFVERFELVVVGRELANAFTELTDPLDQRERFEAQERLDGSHQVDEDYLRALEYGLPPTGGLGVGIDRLVMLLTDQSSIRDVLLFPHMREER